MDLAEFLDHLNSGKLVKGGSEAHQFMHGVSQEALRITAEINGSYHEPAQLRVLFSELTGRPVDESFGLFPPFTPTAERISTLAKMSLSTWGASFRTRVAFSSRMGHLSATMWCWLTRDLVSSPKDRGSMIPAPIRIGKNVWVGANAVILPGVTIGDGAIVAAGAVVNRDVPENTVVGGVPAKVIRTIHEEEQA